MRLFLLSFIFYTSSSLAQPLLQFNQERIQKDKRLMLGLGSWASANFLVSGVGWATVPKGEAYYFHQMNVLWNTVNIGLAIPGYFNAKKSLYPKMNSIELSTSGLGIKWNIGANSGLIKSKSLI